MSYTDPTTRTTGDLITAAIWNTDIVANIQAMRPDTGIARRQAVQSIDTSSDTFITLDTEDDDTVGFFDIATVPTRLTYPYDGVFLVSVFVDFAAGATGMRRIALERNGTGTADQTRSRPAAASGPGYMQLYLMTPRVAGDYHELEVWHDQGSALDATAKISVATLRNDG
jgi:hypothetical protein